MDTEATIRSYLPQVIHMSLATCRDNHPWVCEVHFAYDQDLNLYFRSIPSRRHSQEIAANPHVAGNIITQHHLGQKVRGVYFEGMAHKAAQTDIEDSFKYLAQRFDFGNDILADAKTDDGHQIYKITVSDFYVFDSYGPGPSAKHHLSWSA